MVPQKNDISQLTLLSRVLFWPWIRLMAIATLKSGQNDSFWKIFNIFCPSERKTVENALSIKSGKCLYFNLNLVYRNAWRYLHSAEEVSSKTDEIQVSESHPKLWILHSCQILSRLGKIQQYHYKVFDQDSHSEKLYGSWDPEVLICTFALLLWKRVTCQKLA